MTHHVPCMQTPDTQVYGWGARIRTWVCGDQNPVPYRLATPQIRQPVWQILILALPARITPYLPVLRPVCPAGIRAGPRAVQICSRQICRTWVCGDQNPVPYRLATPQIRQPVWQISSWHCLPGSLRTSLYFALYALRAVQICSRLHPCQEGSPDWFAAIRHLPAQAVPAGGNNFCRVPQIPARTMVLSATALSPDILH